MPSKKTGPRMIGAMKKITPGGFIPIRRSLHCRKINADMVKEAATQWLNKREMASMPFHTDFGKNDPARRHSP